MRILSSFVSATDIFAVFISQFIQQEMTTNYYRNSKLVGHKLPGTLSQNKKSVASHASNTSIMLCLALQHLHDAAMV